jgi:CubicO group peptidase (beta-lactamase class C family)
VAIRWNRIETWLTLGVGGIGLILLFVGGLWVYMSATATPIHPDQQTISSVAGGDPARQWSAAVDRARQLVRADVAERNLPGLSVAVGINGDIVWSEGFGWADIEKQIPVGPRTRFRIGTASIPLTSAGVGVLVEQGKLNLDERIQTHVPEFPEKKWPITLRHLMAHTAGLPTDNGDEGPLFGQHCDRAVEAFPAFADRELRFEPGTEYYHSRFSFIPVSAAIESAAGEPFLIFMRKAVFEPLGMNDTAADSPTAPPAEQATAYFPRFAADPRYGPDLMRDLDYSCYAGASVFASTPSDLVRFAMALGNGKLLKRKTVDLLQTPQRLPSGQQTGYGLGWDVETVTLAGQPTTVVGHDGDSLGGVMSSLMVFRDRGLVVAVISNVSYSDTPSIALKIAEAFASK